MKKVIIGKELREVTIYRYICEVCKREYDTEEEAKECTDLCRFTNCEHDEINYSLYGFSGSFNEDLDIVEHPSLSIEGECSRCGAAISEVRIEGKKYIQLFLAKIQPIAEQYKKFSIYKTKEEDFE